MTEQSWLLTARTPQMTDMTEETTAETHVLNEHERMLIASALREGTNGRGLVAPWLLAMMEHPNPQAAIAVTITVPVQ